ncbi:hypothetical protein B0T25DRAFT_592872 [Lasiosphaeria hispida]|uniref:Uncharacterized protein n=1 Tax=Lasiosphaeria hispida TaxID=260671 RepID=A0AAJ0HCJ4_9PEZI|nr:hypothetical protein B0T25DRAFT_592872 [Lasiosphaeria hispida]
MARYVPEAPQATCLSPEALQCASALTGQENGTAGMGSGQAKSETDTANFINFCAGQQLTNGKQVANGSCNGIPMGRIPASKNMISAIITEPGPGDKLLANVTFEVTIQTRNLHAGFQANPAATYYAAPQDLDAEGYVMGHCHVVIEEIDDLRSNAAPDPTDFVFFRGINDAGDGRGLLRAQVPGGLPRGTYRACTMVAARNHQPVVMPVAQRGAQNDCVRFVVGAGEK